MADHGTAIMAPRPVAFHDIPVALFNLTQDPQKMYPLYCVFLILFSAGLRVMVAFKPALDRRGWGTRWRDGNPKGTNGTFVRLGDDRSEEIELRERTVGIAHLPPGAELPPRPGKHPFNLRGFILTIVERIIRACFEVFVVFLGYIIMLVVMTMNTGYFLSILLGVFLSTLFLGNRGMHR